MTYDYNNGTYNEEKPAGPKASVPEYVGSATAEGSIVMNGAAFQFFQSGSSGESEVWTAARLAGIFGAKKADENILVSHLFNIVGIEMDYEAVEADQNLLTIRCHVRTKERTGSETAALVGCGTALMAVVDRLRAVDRNMIINGLRIVRE